MARLPRAEGGYEKCVPEEDPKQRRLRQMAETAGSLAPSRIGAWTTPGRVAGEPWSDLPWIARVAFVLLFVMVAAAVVLLIVVAVRAGQVGGAVFVAACIAALTCAVVIGRIRRRTRDHHDFAVEPP